VFFIVVPTCAVALDSSGASEVTVTTSEMPPTASVESRVTISARPTVMPSRRTVVNPCNVNVMV
jgi:hypothetical protein